eukprot:TRINITY_DN1671_c0_g6_i1.p1 TRINITY_DN1671_c0_g6~~TRINITY_DN1671_c0_g6_i1.p1  ORF type:complete len:102 (-),score=18.09 TRINITY_DN1671_c0_g6_i1:112-417(-)
MEEKSEGKVGKKKSSGGSSSSGSAEGKHPEEGKPRHKERKHTRHKKAETRSRYPQERQEGTGKHGRNKKILNSLFTLAIDKAEHIPPPFCTFDETRNTSNN